MVLVEILVVSTSEFATLPYTVMGHDSWMKRCHLKLCVYIGYLVSAIRGPLTSVQAEDHIITSIYGMLSLVHNDSE